jgi:nucleotide-binding universal stress UspA family protein
MFETILVPLDGSQLAEMALAPACRLAEKFGSQLILLRVVTPDSPPPPLPLPSMSSEPAALPAGRPLMEEAEAYLTGLKLPVLGVPIRTQVLSGTPPELIVATAQEFGVDLIVMSTHGRSGLMRLLYGSVAEAVLRGAIVPVLLMPSRVPSKGRLASEPVLPATLPKPRAASFSLR